jgi:hypothetical protein
MAWWKRTIVVRDDAVTSAAHLTLKQSLVPNALGMQITVTERRTFKPCANSLL